MPIPTQAGAVQALRVSGWGRDPEPTEIPDPVPAPDETLVRVRAATVSHLDRTIWGGHFLRPPDLPYTPGVEGSGVVETSGRFDAGQRVWIRGAGLGVARDGTWAELVAAPDAALGPLPDEVGDDVGAAFFSPCTSAWVALHEVGGVADGEHVVVTGVTGAVGSVAAQLALDAGATVTGVARTPTATAPDGVTVVTPERLGETAPADLLVDTVGGPVLAQALPSVAPGGRAVLVGYVAGTDLRLDLAALIQRNVALLPLNMIAREQAGRRAVPDLLDRLADGRLAVPTTRFDLDRGAAALAWLTEPGHTGRAVLRPAPHDPGASL